jgi:hypothetical protein
MNMKIIALLLLAAGPVCAQSQDPISLVQSVASSIPSGAWTGRLDLTPDFGAGAWQSVKSPDQAYGVSKRLFMLQKGGNDLLNLGLFVGVNKPLVPLAGSPLRFLGGATIAVPGSTLDWALGTNWGSQWAPALKTGVLCAYDLTRIKQVKAVPDFVGIGATYFFTVGAK